jgi:hypothetical protein
LSRSDSLDIRRPNREVIGVEDPWANAYFRFALRFVFRADFFAADFDFAFFAMLPS